MIEYEEIFIERKYEIPQVGAYEVHMGDLTIWMVDGEEHRIDGPARVDYRYIHCQIPLTYWKRHGKTHRTDGPALEYYSESRKRMAQEYWLDGERFQYEEWDKLRKKWILVEDQERLKDQVI